MHDHNADRYPPGTTASFLAAVRAGATRAATRIAYSPPERDRASLQQAKDCKKKPDPCDVRNDDPA
jgi:hypothetical protein